MVLTATHCTRPWFQTGWGLNNGCWHWGRSTIWSLRAFSPCSWLWGHQEAKLPPCCPKPQAGGASTFNLFFLSLELPMISIFCHSVTRLFFVCFFVLGRAKLKASYRSSRAIQTEGGGSAFDFSKRETHKNVHSLTRGEQRHNLTNCGWLLPLKENRPHVHTSSFCEVDTEAKQITTGGNED